MEQLHAHEVLLKKKGKFMPTADGFTVDITKVCSH